MKAARVTLEMGYTRADLMRSISDAFGGCAAFNGDTIVIALPEGSVRITFSGDRERRIALLRLPVLDVDIAFDGFDEAAARVFLERFDAYTRRGGG